ncbi:MAG: hypothetical protein QF596_04735 [Acidimicrobiales bacterium]|nr:hypothetical protein [Acidimicrobiales bacterium]HJM96555.1 hypothetical protein [Acidimicrobiales bacterium]
MKTLRLWISVITVFLIFIPACGSQSEITVAATGTRDVDPGPGMFLQASEAKQRAIELGCDGSHEHLMDGKTWFMPCSDHVAWAMLTGETHDHAVEESQDSGDNHGHSHDHDHGSSNMMMSVSPDVADVVIEIEFRDGTVVTSEDRVSVSNGDQIVFSVVSDVDEVVHVHGVDLMGEVSSNRSENYFGFEINASGIFEVEFEYSGVFITELLVS